MSQLTAHIVYGTFKALDETQRDEFMRLIEKERKKFKEKKPKKKSVYDTIDPIFHPDNIEQLMAEIAHG